MKNHKESSHITLENICRNVTNVNTDTFVGLEFRKDVSGRQITVNFPLGYYISDTEDELRDDIISLLKLLEQAKNKGNISMINPNINNQLEYNPPLKAYFEVLSYFLNNGYYTEIEEEYKRGLSGPVNWKRTINKEKPYASLDGFVYPVFHVRRKNDTEKDIITEINKYCVNESFDKVGWLFKQKQPLPFNHIPNLKKYEYIILNRLPQINNDKIKLLFYAMLDIVRYSSSIKEIDTFNFGTNKFEHIWEDLVNETFSNVDKDNFLPRTNWHLFSDKNKSNKALQPDTIMETDGSIYILDAKYYKYGITKKPSDLPASSSIHKQITYGEYIDENYDQYDGTNIYNAFILPYSLNSNIFTNKYDNYYFIGEARSDWKMNDYTYEKVQGILIDTKTIIKNKVKPNTIELNRLATAIQQSIEKNRLLQSQDKPEK